MAESVSDKKIMDSYLGVLRISADDGVLSTEKQYICDSDGHTSSIALTERETYLENKVIFGTEEDAAVLTGNISSGNLIGDNFSIETEGKVSLSFSPVKKEDGIYITSSNSSLVSFTSNGTTFEGQTNLLCDTIIDARKTHKIRTVSGDVTLNLNPDRADAVLKVNADGTSVSFDSISQMIEDKVKQYIGNTGTQKNNLVPVGSVIYITLPSYDFFRINLKNLTSFLMDNKVSKQFVDKYDDNKGSGYSMVEAARVLNGYLAGTSAEQYQLRIVENASIAVENWYTGDKEEDNTVKGVSYLLGIDIDKPKENIEKTQKLFNECICAVSGLELRMPKQYLGYWDFCLGQSETTFNDPLTPSGGHTPYTKAVFPQLWQVLRPLDDRGTSDSFCLPNLGYNFIRCAGQDPLHGKASKVILQSTDNPNKSTIGEPANTKVLPFGTTLENGCAYNNMVKYDQYNAPYISDHDEPTTIVQDQGSYVPHDGKEQLTDYRGISKGMGETLSKTSTDSDSFCIYSYIGPDTFPQDAHTAMQSNEKLACNGAFSLQLPNNNTKSITDGYYAGGGSAYYLLRTNRILLDSSKLKNISSLVDWLGTDVVRSENRPRHSVLIPIIKIRDIS